MELILVRHGLPERQVVEEGRADPPLSDTGHAQAAAVADWLMPESVDAVYSSTMLRARQTALPYAEQKGMAIIEREGIVEFDRHSSSYIPVEELKKEDPEAWRALAEGGYSDEVDLHEFHASVVNTLEQIIAAHSSETVVVFCHGGVINIWTAHLLGLGPSMFFEPKYTCVNRYLCARTGQRNLVSLNETAHLR
ncbi:MAG: histidine phosphatase family protein [Gammaproteobacteria bacterium]|nr:histidine phosphatase family protein [Gammaproteobacteria bacterium]